MFPAKPFDIRRKENRKWHKPRRYTVRELLLMGRTMMFCVFPMKKFTEEAWSAGIITLQRQDTSLNNTIPISMLEERRELRNAQFKKKHELIHDAIMAVELNKNEVEERKEKLAAKLQKEQEKFMVQDKKEGSGNSYSYTSADLSAPMFKLNIADIHENVSEQGEGSKIEVNQVTTTRDKGKGRAVEDKLEGLGQKFASSDIGSNVEIKPYSSQYRFRAAPMSVELPGDSEINLYILKPLPVPPELNIFRSECGRVQTPSEINHDAKRNTNKLYKGKDKAMDTIPEESDQSEGESEPNNKHNLGSSKIDKGKGKSLGDILDKFPSPPSTNNSRDNKRNGISTSGSGPAQSPFYMDSGLEVNLTMTNESFSQLEERILELREQLRRQFEDFGTNSSVPAAAPASSRSKAPSKVYVPDTNEPEKFAMAPQRPSQSSGDNYESSEKEDILISSTYH